MAEIAAGTVTNYTTFIQPKRGKTTGEGNVAHNRTRFCPIACPMQHAGCRQHLAA